MPGDSEIDALKQMSAEHSDRIAGLERQVAVQKSKQEEFSRQLRDLGGDIYAMRGESRAASGELRTQVSQLQTSVDRHQGAVAFAAWAVPLCIVLANALMGLAVWVISNGG